MVQAKFSDEMVEIIRDMVGNVLLSYEYGATVLNEAYCNFQLNFDNFSIEFLNEVNELPFYDSTEDIAYFTCKKKSPDEVFIPYCIEPSEKHPINEKVLSVYIVEDTVSVNNGEYDICFDMAIIIQTAEHKYIFSKGWFFSETIDISIDKEFDDIYPTDRVVADWSDEGSYEVKVVRNISEIIHSI